MYGMAAAMSKGKAEDEIDAEVLADLGPHHLAMVRFYTLGNEKSKLMFQLRCTRCSQQVTYEPHKTDADLNEWKCGGCTAPGNVIFRDFEMKTLPLVRLQQAFFIARQYSSKEDVKKLVQVKGATGVYSTLREMTPTEREDYHLRIVDNSVQAYLRARPTPKD